MPNPTDYAAGGAMPAEGQFVPRTRLGAKINVADAIDQTRCLIIAASNLAAGVDDTQAQGLHAVICAAEENFDVVRDWYLVRHAAAPTSDETSSRRDPDPKRDLLNICDDIDEVRHLIEAVWMGVESFSDVEHDREAQSALHAVLDVAKAKLTAARNKLNIARGAAPVEDRADA